MSNDRVLKLRDCNMSYFWNIPIRYYLLQLHLHSCSETNHASYVLFQVRSAYIIFPDFHYVIKFGDHDHHERISRHIKASADAR